MTIPLNPRLLVLISVLLLLLLVLFSLLMIQVHPLFLATLASTPGPDIISHSH